MLLSLLKVDLVACILTNMYNLDGTLALFFLDLRIAVKLVRNVLICYVHFHFTG